MARLPFVYLDFFMYDNKIHSFDLTHTNCEVLNDVVGWEFLSLAVDSRTERYEINTADLHPPKPQERRAVC